AIPRNASTARFVVASSIVRVLLDALSIAGVGPLRRGAERAEIGERSSLPPRNRLRGRGAHHGFFKGGADILERNTLRGSECFISAVHADIGTGSEAVCAVAPDGAAQCPRRARKSLWTRTC